MRISFQGVGWAGGGIREAPILRYSIVLRGVGNEDDGGVLVIVSYVLSQEGRMGHHIRDQMGMKIGNGKMGKWIGERGPSSICPNPRHQSSEFQPDISRLHIRIIQSRL